MNTELWPYILREIKKRSRENSIYLETCNKRNVCIKTFKRKWEESEGF